jgi:hypothetical protein
VFSIDVIPHSQEERLGVLLIRVRVASGTEQGPLIIGVSSKADVESDQQESVTFSHEDEALAWIGQWLRAVATRQ